MQASHVVVLLIALIIGLVLGVKQPAMVSKFTGGLIAA